MLAGAAGLAGCAAGGGRDAVEHAIDAAVLPLMERERIPGMAVGVVRGDDTIIRCFGVASIESGASVGADTFFEVGSISKTFTALLGASVAADGRMSLDDPVASYMPELADSPVGTVTLAQLATYTAGGLPLQVPSEVRDDTLMSYFSAWAPQYPAGTHRQYSNPSIGLFGRACAAAAGRDFEEMMTGRILPALGLHDTYINIPPAASGRYAVGYDRHDRPVRVNPGVLDDETYGIKTTVADMCRYLRGMMTTDDSAPLGRAIAMTRRGYFSIGPMNQTLGWECYDHPVSLDDLQIGNSPQVIFEPNPTEPPRRLGRDVLYNKTGSTGGFGAYALFIPSRRIGIVILANRSYPIAERITAAYAVLRAVDPTRLAAAEEAPR